MLLTLLNGACVVWLCEGYSATDACSLEELLTPHLLILPSAVQQFPKAKHPTAQMPETSSTIGIIQKALHSGIQRCLHSPVHSPSNSLISSSDFFSHLASNQQAQAPFPNAPHLLELPLHVLQQVFKHLDSKTLCTCSAVCKQWHQAALAPQLWSERCDPQLLAAVAAAADKGAAAAAYSCDSVGQQLSLCGSGLLSSTRQPCYPVQLPLLHYAVYSCNLLRNPLFQAAANQDWPLQCGKAAGSSTKPSAVLTSDQRKYAWVTTVGAPTWEQLPAAASTVQPPPLPLRYPAASSSSSSSIHARLHGWFFGRPAPPGGSSASSNSGSSSCGGVAAWGDAAASTASSCAGAGSSHLATGSNWAEVVQVVDLLGELTARGLDPSTAAAVLDGAGLAIALSFWVSAEPATAAAATAEAGAGPQLTPPANAALLGATPGMQQQCSSHSSGSRGSLFSATAAAAAGPFSRDAVAWSPAQFAAALMLDDGEVPLRSFQTFLRTDSSHHFFSKRLAITPADGWRRYAYVVPCSPKGIRRAVVLLRGRGTAPGSSAAAAVAAASAAGAAAAGGSDGSGVRFACAQLCFVRRADVEGLGAEECLAGWQGRVVQGF